MEPAPGIRTYRDAVALITGGASGIGAAWAKSLAGRGAKVILADRQEPEAGALARSLGGDALGLDVRDAAAFDAAVAGVFARHGRLDYLFNNAGTGIGGEAKDYTLDDWRYVIDVNLMGVVHGVQAAYSRMIRQGFGHIVNTASMAGQMATPLAVVYGTTKHAVVGLSRSLRAEGRLYGVRVSVVCPGVIRTPILSGGRYGYVKVPVPVAKQIEVWERLRPMDPDVFAAKVLRAVAANRSIIVFPVWWRLVWWLNRLSPTVADWIAHRAFVSAKAELEAAAAGAGSPTDATPRAGGE
jgi:NAD(P)-dependent dehydrogenase (short-subunit alcohol dehydrogenase family)